MGKGINVKNFWEISPYFDEQTRHEVASLTDEKEITERFGMELEFGTGGLRGIMGAGTNRINRYTVRKATAGLAMYLKNTVKGEINVAIAYDSRNHSAEYAKETGLTLCSYGIKAHLFSYISATPLLSFAVRHLKCDAGVVITASHNPKEYNGYKVYGADGCQAVPHIADGIISYINGIKDITTISPITEDEAREKGLLSDIGEDVLDDFVDAVLLQTTKQESNLKIVYTPLHGAGKEPVRRALNKLGYDLTTVPEQAEPDGDFSTVNSPNPENHEALAMAVSLAQNTDADIVLGTAPDSDRVGVAVRTVNGFEYLTGNQIGALVANYLLETRDWDWTKKVLVKTVVTNDLGAEIARRKGVEIRNTLTGFKYIGEQMEKMSDGQFFMGYEESYGYLVGTHARDKDAVVSSVIICEMASYYKKNGKTLIDVMDGLYEEYGYYLDALDSFTLKGIEGMEKIKSLMAYFRTEGKSLFSNVTEVLDYAEGIDGLPKSDVLKFCFT
ncbi:MAG: phospho-sugar mutase [Clostridia bacterium]|nr:phospho-sugar mutase [Clostridia bacterium]